MAEASGDKDAPFELSRSSDDIAELQSDILSVGFYSAPEFGTVYGKYKTVRVGIQYKSYLNKVYF